MPVCKRALRCNADKFSDQACIAEFARRHFPGNGSLLDNQDALRERGDEIEILFDQNHREPAFGPQPLQGLDDLVDDGRLNAFRRLVEQNEARIAVVLGLILGTALALFRESRFLGYLST